MSRINSFIIILLFAITLGGCASILNPYESEFNCPKTENGKCVSVDTAYEESLVKTGQKNASFSRPCPEGSKCDGYKEEKSANSKSDDLEYQTEVHKKLAGLLRDPVTPIVTPPTVLRVMMLPYQGDESELYMQRYVYIYADKPRWVLGDYLNSKEAGIQ